MFTVLIAEKEHIDAIRQENKLFFEPFLESKNLALCEWNPEGQDLSDAVPGLLDAVGRREHWRAVVINNTTAVTLKERNPFDTVDRSTLDALVVPESTPGPDESWDSWEDTWREYFEQLAERKEAIYQRAMEFPLQKLTTWLCFKPEGYIFNEVLENTNAQDWAVEEMTRRQMKPSFRLEMLEMHQYKYELHMKEIIRREFAGENRLDITQPAEVHCISIRTPDVDYFDPDAYWRVRKEDDYSAFADRNMYFDKMRFLVFDLLAPSHRNYRSDYIRFLASALIFASHPVPSSALQARRLYLLETKTDDTPLCTLVTSYDRKLQATWEVIANEMEKIRSEIPGEMTDKAAEAMYCTSREIPVVLDSSCDPDKVFAEKDYGLFFDRPENEHHKWTHNYETSEKALSYIARQQLRSVRKSVGQMHLSSQVADDNISRLTPLQVDDIREFTNTAEDEMVASIPPAIGDISDYTRRLDRESESVKKVIRGRMTRKTALGLGALCFGLYLICFLPFLAGNMDTTKSTANALTISAVMLVGLLVIMVICLLVLRSRVVGAVKDYNAAAQGILAEIHATLKQVSRYLSASCNVRRGHAVQNYTRKNMDEYTRGLRIRKKHQEDIRKKRACLAEDYGDYFGDRAMCDPTMSRPYEYDFDLQTEFAYPAPFLAGDCRQIEFISSGNFVTVPTSYVTQILVRLEGIYEK